MFDFAHKISFPYYTTLCMNKERKESCFNCSGFTELLLFIYRINNSHPADSRAGCCLERSAISSLSRPQAPAKPTGTLTDTGNALNCFHFPPKAPAVPFCDTPCFSVYLLMPPSAQDGFSLECYHRRFFSLRRYFAALSQYTGHPQAPPSFKVKHSNEK